jgi:AcrR family transcriptional regulator
MSYPGFSEAGENYSEVTMACTILRSTKKPRLLIRDRDLLQQKREAVAEAAFELFLKEGFHRTTTRDIARRAGVSAGAPFTYFKDKEDILFHIVSQEQDRAGEQLLSALSQQLAEATRTGADPEEVFNSVFATFLRAVDAMRRFVLLAYQETKSLNTETRQALVARDRRLQAADRRGHPLRSGAGSFRLGQHCTQGPHHHGLGPRLGYPPVGVCRGDGID